MPNVIPWLRSMVSSDTQGSPLRCSSVCETIVRVRGRISSGLERSRFLWDLPVLRLLVSQILLVGSLEEAPVQDIPPP